MRIKRLTLAIGLILLGAVAVVSVAVERESPYVFEALGGPGVARALVLYHPSRDAHFSDDLSLAVVGGLKRAGLSVDRATLTRETPARPVGYALVAVVSNTYYSAPDLPTLHYLRRARFAGVSAIGVIGGAGSTQRSERLLGEALRNTGATVLKTQSVWLWRPNDEARMNEPNRHVAAEIVTRLAEEAGQSTRSAAELNCP